MRTSILWGVGITILASAGRAFPSILCYSIDCAGILKLRNSDIELRKGETDIGRKNTRVRLVFRVHVPQGNGKVVSVQTASVPIECCEQRGLMPSLYLLRPSYLCIYLFTYFFCIVSCAPSLLGSPIKDLVLISILEGWRQCSNLPLLHAGSVSGQDQMALSSLCPGWLCALVSITL